MHVREIWRRRSSKTNDTVRYRWTLWRVKISSTRLRFHVSIVPEIEKNVACLPEERFPGLGSSVPCFRSASRQQFRKAGHFANSCSRLRTGYEDFIAIVLPIQRSWGGPRTYRIDRGHVARAHHVRSYAHGKLSAKRSPRSKVRFLVPSSFDLFRIDIIHWYNFKRERCILHIYRVIYLHDMPVCSDIKRRSNYRRYQCQCLRVATLYLRQLCNTIAYDNVENLEYYWTLPWRIWSLEISKNSCRRNVWRTFISLLWIFFLFIMDKNDAS